MQKSRLTNLIFMFLTLAVVAVFTFPFYWAASLSIRSKQEAFTVSGVAVPFVQFTPTLENWQDQLAAGEIQRALINSVIVALCTSILVVILGTPAAYVISRFKFKRPSNEGLTLWFLSQRVLPPVATAVPFYLVMANLGLLDTRTGLILLNITFNLPFVVVIMRQAFLDLPIELEEAALVEGAGYMKIFYKIALPLTAPSLAASVLIVIAFTWNEFLFGLMIGDKNARVIPVQMALAVDTRGVQFWFLAVRALIAMLPPVAIALIAQRYIVRGLTLGAVKG